MDIRTFFTARQLTEVRRLYGTWTGFLESEGFEPASPEGDFMVHRNAAMYAYLIGDHERAVRLLRRAVDVGFPPDARFAIKNERDREWKNYEDGVSALRVGLAAHIIGLEERRDEILAWSVERLLDTESLTEDPDRTAARVSLYRPYAMLATGRFWPKTDAELALAAQLIHEASDLTYEWSLPKVLTALVQNLKGNVTRTEATTSLVRLVLDAKRDVDDRIQACFHILFLQSAFPDVFDPILPALAPSA